jgi:hypothetical protein
MPPIALTDAQLSAVFDAARPLPLASRDAFLLDVAAALGSLVNPGDGDVARAIRAVQRRHWDPPITDARVEPHPRRMASGRTTRNRPARRRISWGIPWVAAGDFCLFPFPHGDRRQISIAIDGLFAHVFPATEQEYCEGDRNQPAEDGAKRPVPCPVVAHHQLRSGLRPTPVPDRGS